MITSSQNTTDQQSMIFPDMTALLDVIFILLVFLLLTANVAPKALTINLPEEGNDNAQPIRNTQPITITLFADNTRWALDNQAFTQWLEFENALLQTINQRSLQGKLTPEVILAADKNVSLEKMLKIFGWLQKHQLSAANILIKNPE